MSYSLFGSWRVKVCCYIACYLLHLVDLFIPTRTRLLWEAFSQAYSSMPQQRITQPMETLLTKYTLIVLLDLYNVKFQLIDSHNSTRSKISNCFSCRIHIQWFWLLYLFPSIFFLLIIIIMFYVFILYWLLVLQTKAGCLPIFALSYWNPGS